MKKVALVTCSALPELTDDDRLLIPTLRRRGVEATPVVWDAPVDWTLFDRVILRSCWDYHLRTTEFLEWIEELDRLSVPLQNSASLVRWNTDKRYLLELQSAGMRIPLTVWIDDHEDANVHAILDAQGWDSAVAKPTVSASAHLLKRVFKGEPVVRVKGPAMIQEFMPEILAPGELSLVFIAGEFSHSVVKLPTPGEFRVQSQFGGTARTVQPSPETIATANRIVEVLPDRPLYARVDGIQCNAGFVLMEVEVIEPVLFLALGNAVERFADAIVDFPARTWPAE